MVDVMIVKMSEAESVSLNDATLYGYDIVADGTVVGSAMIIDWHTGDHDFTQVDRIDVDEEYRGRGYGTAALKALRAEFGSIVLAPDNEDAARLYARLGEEYRDRDADDTTGYIDVGYGVYEI